VILFSIAQTVTYLHFLESGRANIDLVPTLVLQELWLAYSFISSTIPCMRSFVGAFSGSRMMITTINPSVSTYARGGSGIALGTLKKSSRIKSANVTCVDEFGSDNAGYKVAVGQGRKRRNGEGDSVASDGSEQMIIRCNTRIQVDSEDRIK